MESKKKLGIGALILAVATGLSHLTQEKIIEYRCNSTIKSSTNEVREDLDTILRLSRPTGVRDDYLFLVGDFRENSRCGGYARIVSEQGSKLGFSSDIRLKQSGFGLHYYAVLSRDGKSYAFYETSWEEK